MDSPPSRSMEHGASSRGSCKRGSSSTANTCEDTLCSMHLHKDISNQKGKESCKHIRKLRETLQGHPLEVILTLALVTGMRRDELLHLQWQDIDLEKGELRVLNSKTQSGRQLIRVSQELTEMLKQHRT